MSYITIDKTLPPNIVAALEAANLPPGVIIKKNKLGRWVGIKEAVYEKLESLGPFATKSAKLQIKFEENSGRYSIDFSKHEKLTIFESLEVISSGSHGPFTKVTLPEIAKAAASVATLNNQQKQNLEDPVSRGDPEFTFLTFGGFAYFECNVEYTRFLCANALVQGETGLTFEGPQRWRSEYTQFLYRQGRFEPITISSLSEKEVVKSLLPSCKSWAPCSDGGFVYLYNSDGTPHPFDCYFSVTPQLRSPSSPLSTSSSLSSSPSSYISLSTSPSSSFSSPSFSSRSSSSLPPSLSSSPTSPCPISSPLSSSFSSLQISPQMQERLQKEKQRQKEEQKKEKEMEIERERGGEGEKELEREKEREGEKEKPFSVVEKMKKPMVGTIEEYLCSVCLFQPVRVMLLPCKHLCVCSECIVSMRKKSETVYCPLCRERVTDSWTVFVSES